MLNGIINVYKEPGFTSFDVVAKMRGIFHQKKIGHTGTLDPDAKGVLPVCMGRATKVCELLTDKSKEYEAVLLLGIKTDTQDISGTVLETQGVNVTEDEVYNAVMSFVGEYDQIPPMYSALKVNGQKLCDLAREGIVVDRKARRIRIHSIEILSMELPEVVLRVYCSKGTYIRTLCEDIGEKLGCPSCMKSLTRTRVSEFLLQDAWKLGEIEDFLRDNPELSPEEYPFYKPIETVFLELPVYTATEEAQKLIINGNKIPQAFLDSVPSPGISFRLHDCEGHFIGIYVYKEGEQQIVPIRIFMER